MSEKSELFIKDISPWVEQAKEASAGYCAHCEAREKMANRIIDKLHTHAGTYEFTDEEADELIGAVDFMRAEGYW